MAENTEYENSFRSVLVKFFKFCFLAVASLYLSATVVVLMALRHPVWHMQLLRFIYRTWAVFVAEKIGSTSPGFVNSIAVAVVGFILTLIGIGFFQGLPAMRKHIIETVAMGIVGLATVLLLVYGTQFAWEVVHAGYNDHQGLVGRISRDMEAINKLQNQPQPVCPSGKPCICPQGKACTPVEESPKCWISNYHYRRTDETRKWITVVLIACNRELVAKQEAPLRIGLEFDKDVIANLGFGMPGVLDMNQVTYIQQGTEGKRYSASMTMGVIPAYRPLAIPVGAGDEVEGYPTALRGGIAQ